MRLCRFTASQMRIIGLVKLTNHASGHCCSMSWAISITGPILRAAWANPPGPPFSEYGDRTSYFSGISWSLRHSPSRAPTSIAETTNEAPSSASWWRGCAVIVISAPHSRLRRSARRLTMSRLTGLRSTRAIVEPHSLCERISAERVFSPKEALPAPVTTILVGSVIGPILFGSAIACTRRNASCGGACVLRLLVRLDVQVARHAPQQAIRLPVKLHCDLEYRVAVVHLRHGCHGNDLAGQILAEGLEARGGRLPQMYVRDLALAQVRGGKLQPADVADHQHRFLRSDHLSRHHIDRNDRTVEGRNQCPLRQVGLGNIEAGLRL